MTSAGYDDLVAAATVGVGRRPQPVTGLAGPAAAHADVLARDDPAASVLDAAALLTVARRAGVRPATGVSGRNPAVGDTAPELPARAARLLGQVRDTDAGLLADLLAAAGTAGYRVPAPLLPGLLDAAVHDRSLRPAVAAVLGHRGRWLAAHRADWQRVADIAALPVAGDPGVWQSGRRAERRGYLAALRADDPAAARELLAAGWAAETGDDRAQLLPVLARGLSAADEEFLEAALDDRKAAVRAAAAALLAGMPGSAWQRRAAGRARPLLQVAGPPVRRELVARRPTGVDLAAGRDGIGAPPPAPGISAAAWLLTELVAAVPLSEWTARFGLDPAQIVALPVTGDLAVPVHAGWRLAAIRQASPDWAAALLASGPRHPQTLHASRGPLAAWPADDQLAAVLPPAARAARAAALLSRTAITPAALAELTACPGPWPPALAEVVVSTLRSLVSQAPGPPPDAQPGWAATRSAAPRAAAPRWAAPRWAGELASTAARRLPATGGTDYGAALTRLAEASPCPPPWPAVLHRMASTIALRRAFLEEIR
ncbi:MAG: DUF5691 domain-containing protein [Streptosporangiaceae bacterium]